VITKEAKTILKYKDLTTEIHCIWEVKTKVIPVLIRTNPTTSKSFRKYLINRLEMYIKELEKTAYW
jgi:hypothetical protein